MEKKSILEVIKENKGAIIKRALIIAGSIAGVLLAAKVLTGDEDDEEMVEVEDGEIQDAEFSEVESEEE